MDSSNREIWSVVEASPLYVLRFVPFSKNHFGHEQADSDAEEAGLEEDAEAKVADGESTEAESEDNDEDLGIHRNLAHMADCEGLELAQAELDHVDGKSPFVSPDAQVAESFVSEEEILDKGKDMDIRDEEEAMDIEANPGGPAAAPDPEMLDAEARQEPEQQPAQKRRSLHGKQPPSGAWLGAVGAPRKVLKRPGMLKRPAARKVWPNEVCRGYEGAACKFCPQSPGQPAGVHPKRGVRHAQKPRTYTLGLYLTGYARGCGPSCHLQTCFAVVLLGLTLADPQIRNGVEAQPRAWRLERPCIWSAALSPV